MVQGLHRDLDLAVFAPVGQRYKIEYYFPELGVFGWEKEFEIVFGDESKPENHLFTDSVVPIYPGVCALPGQDVLGGSEIQQVSKSESILNGWGEVADVKEVSQRPWSGEIVWIKAAGNRMGLKVTPQHKILVLEGVRRREGEKRSFEKAVEVWKPAGEVTIGDWVCTPKLKPGPLDFGSTVPLDVKAFGKGGHRLTSLERSPIPERLELDEDVVWLMGTYFAEGAASGKSITFSFNHETEIAVADRVERIVQTRFGIKTKVHDDSVHATSHPLGRTLRGWFGNGAENKRVPKWVLGSSERIRAAFLKGAFMGDGYVRRGTESGGKKYYPAVGMNIASKAGAYEIFALLVSLGFRPTIAEDVQGKEAFGAGNPIFRVTVSSDVKRACELLGLPQPEDTERRQTNAFSFFFNDKLWFKVDEVSRENYVGQVHDLNVEPKNSYILNGIVVHNSEGWGEEIVEEHFQNFKAEVLLIIGDVWALSRIPQLAEQNRIRLIVQPAVDFLDPIPQEIIDKLKPALYVVPWVRDGIDRLKAAGLENVYDEPIPLGLNCDLWKPQDRTKWPGIMGNLGFGYDTFNIAIINANQYQRKAWEQTLRGIKVFTEKHPTIPIRLYVHTFLNTADGWNMQQLITGQGLGDITRSPNQYDLITGQFSESQMMLVHALADVVINAGLEGFGYATIQAGSVGTPLIGLNAGPTPELLEKSVLVQPYYDYLTANFLHKVDPHPMQIAQALETVAMETPRSEYASNVEFVRKNFDWPVIIEKWRKFFRVLDGELNRRCIKSGEYPPHPSARALEVAARRLEVA